MSFCFLPINAENIWQIFWEIWNQILDSLLWKSTNLYKTRNQNVIQIRILEFLLIYKLLNTYEKYYSGLYMKISFLSSDKWE